MKTKYLFFLIIIIVPNYNYAFGSNNQKCLIKDSTPKILYNYFSNNKIIVKNLLEGINKNQKILEVKGIKKLTYDINKAKDKTISMLGELFNFRGYYSYFKYMAIYPIKNEVPMEVLRDYRLLKNESESLLKLLKKIDKYGFGDIIVSDICESINKDSCNFIGKNSKQIIISLIENNDNMLDLFRLNVIGEQFKFDSSIKLNLVGSDFQNNFTKYYGEKNMNLCNKENGGFFNTIKKAIKNIKIINDQGKKGITKWQDAWQLLIGNKPYREKQILIEYLQSSGISMENQKILLNNFDRYNNEGFTENNNFINNTLDNIANKIEQLKKELSEDNLGNNGDISNDYNSINNTTENAKKTKEIDLEMKELYENELPYSAIGDINTEKLRAKIIKTHNSLNNSINTLEKTIPISQKVCNDQGGGSMGNGNCN